MSIDKNVQTVKNFLAALGRRDKQALLALVAEDLEWIIPGEDWPLAGTYRGHAGLEGLLQKANETVETSLPLGLRHHSSKWQIDIGSGVCRYTSTGTGLRVRCKPQSLTHQERCYRLFLRPTGLRKSCSSEDRRPARPRRHVRDRHGHQLAMAQSTIPAGVSTC